MCLFIYPGEEVPRLIDKLIERFADLEDPCCPGKVEHRQMDVLVIAICAVIAGAENWKDIAL